MSILTLIHVASGLLGIVCGSIAVAGVLRRRRLPVWNAIFLFSTAISCATALVFLPSWGLTSAQLVNFFMIFLLAVASYARYVRRLEGNWPEVYALVAVGALFSNVLITIAQSFQHVPALNALAPTQDRPVYIAIKVVLILTFTALALLAARRARQS